MDVRLRIREEGEARHDALSLIVATTVVLIAFMAVTFLYLLPVSAVLAPGEKPVVWRRTGINAVAIALMPVMLIIFRVRKAERLRIAVLRILPAALLFGILRAAMFQVDGVNLFAQVGVAIEFTVGSVNGLIGAMLGFVYMRSQRRLRHEVRRSAEQSHQRELALRILEKEEVRIRRAIAEGLHGSLQQRLVIASIQVDMMVAASRARGFGDEEVLALENLRANIEEIRQNDVRETSRMLYPEGLEIGVVAAVRMLLRRLPSGIATKLIVDDALRELDDPATAGIRPADRLLIVRIVEEGVTNGLDHGHATSFVVELNLADGAVLLDVANNGEVIAVEHVSQGSGLTRLRERLALVDGAIRLGSDTEPQRGRPGGTQNFGQHHAHLRARIPLGRGDELADSFTLDPRASRTPLAQASRTRPVAALGKLAHRPAAQGTTTPRPVVPRPTTQQPVAPGVAAMGAVESESGQLGAVRPRMDIPLGPAPGHAALGDVVMDDTGPEVSAHKPVID